MKELHLTFVAFCCALLGVAQSSGNITFSVDMSNYTSAYTEVTVSGDFNAWTSSPLINIGGGIWETTVSIPGGDYEYLYTIDNWIDQEILDPASSCTITNEFGYVHRFYTVDGDASIPTVCWNSCDACAIQGCTDTTACNYDMEATADDGSCEYDCYGCTSQEAVNYDPSVTVDDGSCLYSVSIGLYVPFFIDSAMPVDVNFFPGETSSGTEPMHVFMMQLTAYGDEGGSVWHTTDLLPSGTWNFLFSVDGGVMEDPISFEGGCYEMGLRSFGVPNAGIDDLGYWSWETCNSISYPLGCTDESAVNYDPMALEDDGSCLFPVTFTVDMTIFDEDPVFFGPAELNIFALDWAELELYEDGTSS